MRELNIRQPELHVYGWTLPKPEHLRLIGIVHSTADAEALIDRHRQIIGNGYVFIIGGPIMNIIIHEKPEAK